MRARGMGGEPPAACPGPHQSSGRRRRSIWRPGNRGSHSPARRAVDALPSRFQARRAPGTAARGDAPDRGRMGRWTSSPGPARIPALVMIRLNVMRGVAHGRALSDPCWRFSSCPTSYSARGRGLATVAVELLDPGVGQRGDSVDAEAARRRGGEVGLGEEQHGDGEGRTMRSQRRPTRAGALEAAGHRPRPSCRAARRLTYAASSRNQRRASACELGTSSIRRRWRSASSRKCAGSEL